MPAFFEFAARELADLMGESFRKRLKPIGMHRWAADPFARGSYSYAVPGQSGAREKLGATVEDRIFFAGEACSLRFLHHRAWRIPQRPQGRRRDHRLAQIKAAGHGPGRLTSSPAVLRGFLVDPRRGQFGQFLVGRLFLVEVLLEHAGAIRPAQLLRPGNRACRNA